ncbi:MAG TPA: porphobilinogen synthase [Thermodesulfobium narugense]|uniref:Delta-aminolevulinic acid dehydratase n=1 Tax=Thermodesulfobium acidiphilum TaxID=1794699 RepID=A0A2R4W143_THEAF|nr:porphobilinogen synthase [Thermodesulfobium acidiphilum]AWB10533.1 porphobilinogen synthase [Thermodesulfobium acidiphilum]PMP85000.1 MAG: porphobilinogen synthase [Thermodesulfobium narugense]HEM55231.1 porphobilinogen synthase [Thermodesulfobium narugense]
MFPMYRARRIRQDGIREMLNNSLVEVKKLMLPIFVMPGSNRIEEIVSMPGVYRYTVDRVLNFVEKAVNYGIKSIIFFGISEVKDSIGSWASNREGEVQKAIRMVKKEFPKMVVAADTCLCEYTDHGHCGIVRDGEILNDETLKVLNNIAISYAESGADIIAPSGMMDGMVLSIRNALDTKGFYNTIIMSYSVKYSSCFYGPFRDAAESAPKFGNRKTHQMSPFFGYNEAVKEALIDVEEYADILMVKPGLAYLDVLKVVKDSVLLPVAVYNVSGEYSMVKAASINGWLDEMSTVSEIFYAFLRAGADIIISYHSLDYAKWLAQNGK